MMLRQTALPCSLAALALACAAQPRAPAAEPVAPAAPAGYTGAPAQPSSSPPEDERKAAPGNDDDFANVEAAEAALERANLELNPSARADKGVEKPKKTAESPAPTPATSAGAESALDGRCTNACKAFASLKRAAAAVCRLAGDGDARCKRAQDIVQANETRIAACKCAGSGG